ncbi:MAG: tetratricopeptide repeat protein [Pirellulales bacterium]
MKAHEVAMFPRWKTSGFGLSTPGLRCARLALLAVIAIGLMGPPRSAVLGHEPAPQTAGKPPAVESLQLDDPLEPFVPLRPRTGREEDHIRALALFAAARVAEQKQDYDTALRSYQRAYRFDPNALAALREIVPLAFNLDRQEEGVRYALILAERDPTDPAMLRRLAIYLTEDGDVERALALYEKSVALSEAAPEKPSANTVMTWLEMGRLYFVAKKFDQAARYFAKVNEALENPKEFQLSPPAVAALVNKGELTYQLFGESFLEAGRPDEALAAFEKVNAAKADEARHLYNQARVDARHKQPAQALDKLEKYLAAHHASQGTGPYDLYADVLAELGQDNQLLDRLEKHRAADSENLPLAYFLAERCRKADQLDKAAPIYAALINERKERPPLEAIIGLVQVYHQQKDATKLLAVLGDSVGRAGSLAPLGEAGKNLLADAQTARAIVAAAKQQLADDAAKIDYGQRLAAALVALGLADFDAAQSLFDAALEADKSKPSEVLVNWGLELFMANQYDRAAKVLERGLNEKALPEDNPAIYYYLAGALEMSGRTDEAIERARRAAELRKDSPRFAGRDAWIQFHAKRYDAARQGYLKLLQEYDKKHDSAEVREAMRDARLVLSNISAIEGNLSEAEEWLEQVLDEFPEDLGALNDLGYLWADAGKHLERALEMIQVAVAGDSKNMAYRDSLGWVLFRLGKYPEAVAELKVVASAPDPDGVILDHLADALLKSGDQAAAVEAWKRALAAFEKASETDKARQVRDKLKQAESVPPAKPGAADSKSNEPQDKAAEQARETSK